MAGGRDTGALTNKKKKTAFAPFSASLHFLPVSLIFRFFSLVRCAAVVCSTHTSSSLPRWTEKEQPCFLVFGHSSSSAFATTCQLRRIRVAVSGLLSVRVCVCVGDGLLLQLASRLFLCMCVTHIR
ncbi:hypothetical protein, conserved [Leishmania donovani]|uniref:Uncharacterized protein n=1 Tax=Leishmania donovani TaxID=5661 RepID=E9BSY0_LEIDO|nr:hypothetical protein, conserved [Leishmania donovani]CBZ38359.1 hypothetical protein, conserved [Leishmania donovani]